MRRIQPKKGPAKGSLTLSVALRSHAWRTRRGIAESQGRFHHSHVKESGFPDPERLPSTSTPFAPAQCGMPPHYAEKSPPPCSRLCHRRTGFRRFFTPPMLPHRRARPTRLHRLITCGREGHAPLVDFCNRGDSRAQLARSTKPCIHRQLCPFRSTTSRGFTGQRPAQQTLSPTSFRRDRS